MSRCFAMVNMSCSAQNDLFHGKTFLYEFRDLGITNYYKQLHPSSLVQRPDFATFCETIRNNAPVKSSFLRVISDLAPIYQNHIVFAYNLYHGQLEYFKEFFEFLKTYQKMMGEATSTNIQ